MMKILNYTIIAAILLVIAQSGYAAKLKVGAPPPSFELVNEDGKRVSINSFIDRPTIIYFTHNACHYCTQIIAMLKRADKKFGRKRLRIIGINVMARDERLVRAYKEELGFIFPMLAGNRGDVLRAYKINYVPKLVFIDAKKTVRRVVGHYIHEPELYKNIREIMGQ
jgi:peroxiredoxin